jgi:Co/Zn/Cd efflux system component
VGEIKAQAEQRTLRMALALNATMFRVGMTAGLLARSSALLADALDMLTDASAYAIALLAIRRWPLFKQRAALASGVLLCMVGLSVVAEAVRRAVAGGVPIGIWMLVVPTLSLAVNSTVSRMLAPYRRRSTSSRHLAFRACGCDGEHRRNCRGTPRLGDEVEAARSSDRARNGAYVLKEALEILVSASLATRQLEGQSEAWGIAHGGQ